MEILVAQVDFTTAEDFNTMNWAVFTKHDYNIFNPVHTWIEYINRLIGALSGLPVLVLAVVAVARSRKIGGILFCQWAYSFYFSLKHGWAKWL